MQHLPYRFLSPSRGSWASFDTQLRMTMEKKLKLGLVTKRSLSPKTMKARIWMMTPAVVVMMHSTKCSFPRGPMVHHSTIHCSIILSICQPLHNNQTTLQPINSKGPFRTWPHCVLYCARLWRIHQWRSLNMFISNRWHVYTGTPSQGWQKTLLMRIVCCEMSWWKLGIVMASMKPPCRSHTHNSPWWGCMLRLAKNALQQVLGRRRVVEGSASMVQGGPE